MTNEQITARVDARDIAADCLSLLSSESVGLLGDDARQVFWELIRDAALQRAPLPEVKPPKEKKPVVNFQQDGQLFTFACDECGEEIEIAGGTFGDAWEAAKAHGWRCFQDDAEEWQRRCPDCRGL